MAFAAIFVPNFIVQAVLRAEASLRERALAIIQGVAPIWSGVAANEAAMKAGIQPGMTKSQVEQFCGIEIRHRSLGHEKSAHAALLDLGWSVSPRIEDTAVDTVVVDLTGLNSLLGPDEDIAAQILRCAVAVGLAVNVAVAPKIDVAILAARGFAGLTVIPEGAEAKRLGQLPVSVLSPSIEVLETLENWGIYTCEALAALPVLQLSERLGQEGVRLHELACGQSVRSLVLAEPEIHFEEGMELEDSVEELEPLSFLLARLLNQLCARLVTRSLAACAIRVRFELDPAFNVETQENEFSLRSDDCRRKPTPKIYDRVLTLPVAMRDSKMLLNLLRLHLQSDPPSAPILKIVLAADAARPRFSQGELYLPSSPDPEKLELTVARLASLVGDAHVGSPELMDTHRPDEFRMRRFVSTGDRPEIRRGRGNATAIRQDEVISQEPRELGKSANPRNAFRVFRPALRVSVELQMGCPTRVCVRGICGQVVAASGPWRSSGDWWREDGWQTDEWDLEIVFALSAGMRTDSVNRPQRESTLRASEHSGSERGVYRIFYDSIRQDWFLRGMYD